VSRGRNRFASPTIGQSVAHLNSPARLRAKAKESAQLREPVTGSAGATLVEAAQAKRERRKARNRDQALAGGWRRAAR
jgi:hypothetical protein